MSDIKIEKGGKLTLPPKCVKTLGDQPLRLSSCSQYHVLLESAANSDKVQLSGLVGNVGVVDLLSFFNMFRKSGLLSFTLAGGNKTLYFQNGEIVFAW